MIRDITIGQYYPANSCHSSIRCTGENHCHIFIYCIAICGEYIDGICFGDSTIGGGYQKYRKCH